MRRTTLVVLLILLADPLTYPVSPHSVPDTAGVIRELSRLLQERQITRLEILHVADYLETRTRITPDMVRRLSKVRVVLDNPWESPSFGGLLSSLKDVSSAPKQEPAEVRWAILFFEPNGKEMYAIFLASDGSLGMLQDETQLFHGKQLAWAKGFIQDAFLTAGGGLSKRGAN